MFRFRTPLVGLVIVSLFMAAGCSKKSEQKKPDKPVVQDMDIVKPDTVNSDTK